MKLITLKNFIEMYESSRNDLTEKKLRDSKLTGKETLILNSLNDKLNILLGDKLTQFQKENKKLIAQAHQILFKEN